MNLLDIKPKEMIIEAKVIHADGSITDYGVVAQQGLTDLDIEELSSMVEDYQNLKGE